MYIHIFDCNEEGTIYDMIFICGLHRVTYYHTYKTVVHYELGFLFHIKGRGILYAEGTTSVVL